MEKIKTNYNRENNQEGGVNWVSNFFFRTPQIQAKEAQI